jgi:hypothetical protein
VSAAVDYERSRPYEPPRTIAPRRLAAAPDDLNANATVAEPFTLHNCGLVGSPGFSRTIPAGARVRVESADGRGFVRCHLNPGGGRGALVGAEHFEIDEDVRRGS